MSFKSYLDFKPKRLFIFFENRHEVSVRRTHGVPDERRAATPRALCTSTPNHHVPITAHPRAPPRGCHSGGPCSFLTPTQCHKATCASQVSGTTLPCTLTPREGSQDAAFRNRGYRRSSSYLCGLELSPRELDLAKSSCNGEREWKKRQQGHGSSRHMAKISSLETTKPSRCLPTSSSHQHSPSLSEMRHFRSRGERLAPGYETTQQQQDLAVAVVLTGEGV